MKIWVKVDRPIPESDFVIEIRANGKELCLVRNNGILYAVENTCPHAGGVLSDGWCVNENLVCPVHRYQYNLLTGRGAEGQGDYIYTYPVEERGDGIYVQLKQSWIKRLFKSS
jgi:nitrite reductase/ring-hydroxylating ferredoxin subunit